MSNLEKEIVKSAIKATMHAIVIPTIIFVGLLVFKTDWAGLSFLYWIIPSFVYALSTKHDISRKIYINIMSGIFALILLLGLLVLSSAIA